MNETTINHVIEIISNAAKDSTNFEIIVSTKKSLEQLREENKDKSKVLTHVRRVGTIEETHSLLKQLYNHFEKSEEYKSKFRNKPLEEFKFDDGTYFDFYILGWN